jgi:hypothetical protein
MPKLTDQQKREIVAAVFEPLKSEPPVRSSELVELRHMLEKRKSRHKAAKACEMPRTCGACHFYSGYIQALTDIIEKNLPSIKRQQPNDRIIDSRP